MESQLKGESPTTYPRRGRLLRLAWIGLALVMGGCAHGAPWAPIAEGQFPVPTDPAYPAEVLKTRAEYVRAVERWQRALDALDRLIEIRRAARVSRDQAGKIVGISEDLELPRWRLEMEHELMRAKGALSRLERRVRADFNGEFPAWWPRDSSEADPGPRDVAAEIDETGWKHHVLKTAITG